MKCTCGKEYKKTRSTSGRWVYLRTCRCDDKDRREMVDTNAMRVSMSNGQTGRRPRCE